MNSEIKKIKITKPPVLLKGLFLTILLVIGSILIFAWIIINDQIEQIIVARTSEYAHALTKIGADSSTELMFNNDRLQLQWLASNVTKDPYVRDATFFAEDGRVMAHSEVEQSKEIRTEETNIEPSLQFTSSDKNPFQSNKSAEQTIKTLNDLPFIEEINYQGKTIGWFKITIDRDKLEHHFRLSMSHAKNIVLLVSTLLLFFVFVIIFRFNQKVQKLIAMNHRIIQINSPNIPKDNNEWLNAIYQLSQTHFYQNAEIQYLTPSRNSWVESKVVSATTFCFCEFIMLEQQDEQTALCLNQAEHYLQAAIQNHGIIYQGNILSGCLIPVFKGSSEDALVELISLNYIIKQLLTRLPLKIITRSIISRGDLLVLENERSEISGFSLSNRSQNKLNQVSSQLLSDELICINFELTDLKAFGETESIFPDLPFSCIKLATIAASIQQQANRQVNYIQKNNSMV